MIDTEKLKKWSKEIYDNAVAHGWHEEQHSPEHYLGLIMTEVAEAVEADRKNKHAAMDVFEKEIKSAQNTNKEDEYFKFYFEALVKNCIEDELADIVIRLLDMAYAIHGETLYFVDTGMKYVYNKNKSFIENAWNFTKNTLYWYRWDISYSIIFIYDWAEHLGIDLDTHIKLKMRYNAMREYKHGNKKY